MQSTIFKAKRIIKSTHERAPSQGSNVVGPNHTTIRNPIECSTSSASLPALNPNPSSSMAFQEVPNCISQQYVGGVKTVSITIAKTYRWFLPSMSLSSSVPSVFLFFSCFGLVLYVVLLFPSAYAFVCGFSPVRSPLSSLLSPLSSLF